MQLSMQTLFEYNKIGNSPSAKAGGFRLELKAGFDRPKPACSLDEVYGIQELVLGYFWIPLCSIRATEIPSRGNAV
jgi:hypothetical protein